MIAEGSAIPSGAERVVLPGSVARITSITWDNGIVWDTAVCEKKVKWYRNEQLGVDLPTRELFRTYEYRIVVLI